MTPLTAPLGMSYSMSPVVGTSGGLLAMVHSDSSSSYFGMLVSVVVQCGHSSAVSGVVITSVHVVIRHSQQ